uniref:Uncharacterized protein n=1 Tax=Astyanax mexicanus TaxID=7994 RepID=A0A8B9JTZ7_ASTMX
MFDGLNKLLYDLAGYCGKRESLRSPYLFRLAPVSHCAYSLCVCVCVCLSAGLTSMCSSVKITGSVMKTRLDSLLIEAAMTSEFTATERLRPFPSLASLIVAFSVLRNWPKFLYRAKTNFATPVKTKETKMY